MASTIRQNDTRLKPNWWRQYDSGAFLNSDVVVTGGAYLLALFAANKSSNPLYLMTWDSASVPAGSTVPTTCPLVVPAGGSASLVFYDVSSEFTGLSCANGITYTVSTALASLALDTSSSVFVTCRFIN